MSLSICLPNDRHPVPPPYTDAGYTYRPWPMPQEHQDAAFCARSMVFIAQARHRKALDEFFATMPRGLTFSAILQLDIWIYYDPTFDPSYDAYCISDYGLGHVINSLFGSYKVDHPCVVLTESPLRGWGHSLIAGAIIHECAHINGVGGGADHYLAYEASETGGLPGQRPWRVVAPHP